MRTIRDIFRSYAELDAQGRHVNGTDKESNHAYGDAYETIFNKEKCCSQCEGHSVGKLLRCNTCNNQGSVPFSMRENTNLMMEIGIADGSSLLAWREVFPKATCVGLDIHHSDKAHGDRIEFHLGDQRSRADCERAAQGRQFDFIVEDATHRLADTMLTLFFMWPFVKPGGMYVVEEWDGVSGDRDRIRALWPNVEIVGTCGPNMQDEPLVVFRKPL